MSSMKNKYIIRSRISEKKFREIFMLFLGQYRSREISEFINFVKTIDLVPGFTCLLPTGCALLKTGRGVADKTPVFNFALLVVAPPKKIQA